MSFRFACASHRIFALAIALAAAAAPGAARARPKLDPGRLDQLGRYQVLTFTDPAGGGIRKGKAIAVLDATPDEVFRVVTDYDRYTEYAPHVVVSRVVERQGEARASVVMQTDLPWPVSKAWVQADYEHERLPGRTYRVRFWQVKGSMRRYFGSVLIEPWMTWRGGGKTAITYELVAEPDSFAAPRRWINRKVEAAVSRYVHALRQHINDLHRAGRLHPEVPPDPAAARPLAGRPAPVRRDDVAEAR